VPSVVMFPMPSAISFADACALVDAALEDSVRSRLIADLSRSKPFGRALARLRDHLRANSFDGFLGAFDHRTRQDGFHALHDWDGKADHVLAVSERTKRDVVELYGVPAEKVTVTPHGVDPAFAPGDGTHDGYLLFVGAVQARKDPLAALEAAEAAGLPLVVAGPEKEPELVRELRARGADVRGWVETTELAQLYRRAAAFVLPSRYEGFGVPVLEAMASGTPVVLSDDEALREVAGDAGVYGDVSEGVRTALADRDRYARAGVERASRFTWEESARLTAEVYRGVLS